MLQAPLWHIRLSPAVIYPSALSVSFAFVWGDLIIKKERETRVGKRKSYIKIMVFNLFQKGGKKPSNVSSLLPARWVWWEDQVSHSVSCTWWDPDLLRLRGGKWGTRGVSWETYQGTMSYRCCWDKNGVFLQIQHPSIHSHGSISSYLLLSTQQVSVESQRTKPRQPIGTKPV